MPFSCLFICFQFLSVFPFSAAVRLAFVRPSQTQWWLFHIWQFSPFLVCYIMWVFVIIYFFFFLNSELFQALPFILKIANELYHPYGRYQQSTTNIDLLSDYAKLNIHFVHFTIKLSKWSLIFKWNEWN